MEIRNHSTNMVLSAPLRQALAHVRQERGFNVEHVVEEKIKLLNAYYRQAGLKSAVIAVSGGVDSAVVLGLVEMAARADDSPIERIVAITLPALSNEGVTGQVAASDLAHEVCWAFNVEPIVISMDGIINPIIQKVESALNVGGPVLGGPRYPSKEKERWARGQVVSYARTPTYYYVTSVLSALGQPGLVIGTTNLSEGGYLGYFGKASDGMVDVQLISDLFKSEVYEIGRFLGVPEAVLTRDPTGDMFDATTDEVVFGAPYDFVEIFTHTKWSDLCAAFVDGMVYDYGTAEDRAQYDEFRDNLERMHRYNAHKYLGRSPAVHLDILQSGVNDGWNNPAWRPE